MTVATLSNPPPTRESAARSRAVTSGVEHGPDPNGRGVMLWEADRDCFVCRTAVGRVQPPGGRGSHLGHLRRLMRSSEKGRRTEPGEAVVRFEVPHQRVNELNGRRTTPPPGPPVAPAPRAPRWRDPLGPTDRRGQLLRNLLTRAARMDSGAQCRASPPSTPVPHTSDLIPTIGLDAQAKHRPPQRRER